MRRFFLTQGMIVILAVASIAFLSNKALAQSTDCSEWRDLGYGVSACFKIVTRNFDGPDHAWTWIFKNKGTTTIKSIDYEYIETKNNGKVEKHHDFYPSRIEPGKSAGGWVANMAVSYYQPKINILKVER